MVETTVLEQGNVEVVHTHAYLIMPQLDFLYANFYVFYTQCNSQQNVVPR